MKPLKTLDEFRREGSADFVEAIANSPEPRMLFKTEPGPHSSDCAFWCAEPCNCMFRFDAKDLYDRYMDRQLEGK